MAKRVAWRWVGGRKCPHCGGAVQWMTVSKRDRHSVLGFSEYIEPLLVVDSSKVFPDDEAVYETVGVQGHEGTVRTKWQHRFDVLCKRCDLLMNSSTLVVGEPDEYPVGYWEEV